MKSAILKSALILSLFQASAQDKVTLTKAWSTDTVLKTPESVFYYEPGHVFYVTNMNSIHDQSPDNDGFISVLSTEGKVEKLQWITGLDDPKGMGVYKGKLYVGDLKNLVEIDIAKGSIIKKHTIAGAQFMNDVAVDAEGVVYVTDSFVNKVYRLKNGKLEVWIDGKGLDKPNGVFLSKNRNLLANMNEGAVYDFDIKNKSITRWVQNLPAADGIATDGKGNFFVSNWNGEVYFVNQEGKSSKVLDTKENKVNSADIEFVEKLNLLVVPTFFGNHVSAYVLKKN